ncbi:MAG: hypothetical protein LW821_05445 [Flammeovirgaceae bacterium]|nr:hypothetical protein [Flammeovirgaceae bacterium]
MFEFVVDRLLFVSTLDAQGTLTTASILTDKDPYLFMVPKLTGQFTDGSFVLFGDVLRRYQFLKVTVKK